MKTVLAVLLGVMLLAGWSWTAGHGQTGVDGPKATEPKNHDFVNSIGMKFAWIPPGVFLMGSPEAEQRREADEVQHRVRLTKGLWLGVYPVTQAQWQAVMGNTPSSFKGENLPVEMVSWQECEGLCAALHELDGRHYDMPTEAEWEYACRAGTTTAFHFGDVLDGTQANCDGTFPYGTEAPGVFLRSTTAVGSYVPNAFGICDMHGNVWERCQDHYVAYHSFPDHSEDPVNLQEGDIEGRFIRGGAWETASGGCRSAYRDWRVPRYSYNNVGCRACFRPG